MSKSGQQRKQGKPRTPKKDARRSATAAPVAAAAQPAPVQAASTLSPRAAAFRARRGASLAPVSGFVLSREQEMAYIRADLRRLVYVASGLLLLMLAILFILER